MILKAGERFSGERAQYFSSDTEYSDAVFCDGESPLKHAENIIVKDSEFEWKYPLWNTKNASVENSVFHPMAKSGLWYTENTVIKNSVIDAVKEFRRCRKINLENVKFTDAAETFWMCSDVRLKDVYAKGDYFAMNTTGFYADNLVLEGNYFLDGGKNIEVHNSRLISKDAFWNCENVTVYDSFIEGEYLGWYSKNLKFVNCTISSDQGLCYIDGLTLENCRFENTVLAFEYSKNLNVEIKGRIDSIKNPLSGKIKAGEIGTLILNPERCVPEAVEIDCASVKEIFTQDPNVNER